MKNYFFINKFLIFTIPLIITIILMGLFFLSIAHQFSATQIRQNNEAFISQTQQSLESMMSQFDVINLSICYNPFIRENTKSLLTDPEMPMQKRMIATNVVGSVSDPIVNSKNYINSIYIYLENDHRDDALFFASQDGLCSLKDYWDKEWYAVYRAHPSAPDVWLDFRKHYSRYSFEKEPQRFLTVYKILFLAGQGVKSGVIVENLDVAYLENYFMAMLPSPNQLFLLADEHGRVLFHCSRNKNLKIADGQLIPKGFNDQCMVSQASSERYAIRYILLTPNSTFSPLASSYMGSMLLFFLPISLLVGIIVTFCLTRNDYRDLLAVVDIFNSAGKGKPLPPLPSRTHNINSYILHNIIKTFIEHDYLKMQLSERKYRLQAMEMRAMQSQLNPHFLFNTLKTIYWKTVQFTGGKNEASQMIDHLSELLHYSLGNPDEKVTLEEEISNTKHYVDIQRIRYENKFEIIWFYDEQILCCQVIRLVFQPLIENVIYHAAKSEERIFVKIKIILCGDELHVSVIDNGVGIPRDRLLAIKESLENGNDYSNFVGLQNTNRRLRLTYGEEYGLSVLSKEGRGTVIHFRLPVREKAAVAL